VSWDHAPFRDEGDRLRHMNEIMRAKFARARAERALHEPYPVPTQAAVTIASIWIRLWQRGLHVPR
jgi:hypothetical protein